ncbi:hypothetical protein KKF81_05450 [Candidatus Micrarchaeota archaeon]|nr:hypothetical protein [Candidatus Micrarchaeota archaeon]MBU1166373.1 hypothetical protein [Candidatus Micrarchaeota archaeon]
MMGRVLQLRPRANSGQNNADIADRPGTKPKNIYLVIGPTVEKITKRALQLGIEESGSRSDLVIEPTVVFVEGKKRETRHPMVQIGTTVIGVEEPTILTATSMISVLAAAMRCRQLNEALENIDNDRDSAFATLDKLASVCGLGTICRTDETLRKIAEVLESNFARATNQAALEYGFPRERMGFFLTNELDTDNQAVIALTRIIEDINGELLGLADRAVQMLITLPTGQLTPWEIESIGKNDGLRLLGELPLDNLEIALELLERRWMKLEMIREILIADVIDKTPFVDAAYCCGENSHMNTGGFVQQLLEIKGIAIFETRTFDVYEDE